MQHLRTTFFSIVSGLLLGGSVSAQDQLTPDTVQAVVFYGDEKLLEGEELLTDERLDALLDSLCTLDIPPAELIEDLRLFKRVRSMGGDELVNVIDSLFDEEHVPYALINEINLFVDQLPDQEDVERSPVVPWSVTTYQPGAELYGEWNPLRANPYGPELSANDTLLRLRLTNEDIGAGFKIPLPPVVTSRFGWRNGRNHNGIDLDLEVWDPVRSMFPGVVRFSGVAGGYGRLVVVRHFNGLETYYAHLHRLKVATGDLVNAGDLVGLGGNSGHSTGSHLHLELRFKGVPLDPSHVIDFAAGQLYSDTLVLKKSRWGYTAYPEGTKFHTVGQGEHLSAIAELYGTSLKSLCSINGIRPTSRLRVGQRLMITDQRMGRIAQADGGGHHHHHHH